jgi:hypothetical protein
MQNLKKLNKWSLGTVVVIFSTLMIGGAYYQVSLAQSNDGNFTCQNSTCPLSSSGEMAMNVIIQVQTKTALALQGNLPATQTSQEVQQVAKDLGVELQPLHETNDVNLVKYFTLSVPNQAIAKQAVERFQACAAVESAYLKPLDEMP